MHLRRSLPLGALVSFLLFSYLYLPFNWTASAKSTTVCKSLDVTRDDISTEAVISPARFQQLKQGLRSSRNAQPAAPTNRFHTAQTRPFASSPLFKLSKQPQFLYSNA
jgi:hypothetical protein